MLTTVDLALSYLHFLLAMLHQVGIKSDSLPQGPTGGAPNSYLPQPSSWDCTQGGRKDSTSQVPVTNSWCLHGLLAQPCTHPSWIMASLRGLPVWRDVSLWKRFLLSKRAIVPEPTYLPALTDGAQNLPDQMISFPYHIYVHESSQSINSIRKPTKLKTIAYN